LRQKQSRKRKAKVFWPIGRGHASWTLPHPLHILRWEESFQSPDERFQNVPKITRCSRVKPRGTSRRYEHKPRISSTSQCKKSRVKSIHVRDDPACPEV
jgi:hypothetical protein